MKEAIVIKWLNCEYSVEFGFAGEDGYALKEKGFRENYGCEHPGIVKSGLYIEGSFFENGEKVFVARLHDGIGRDDDPTVIASLNRACKDCPFYKDRST